MKIEGPNKTDGAKGASKPGTKKTGDGAFESLVGESGGSRGAAAASRPSSVGALDALLSLQEAESGTSEEARKRAKKRAADILDKLDQVKVGLLTGELPRSTLQQLSHVVAQHRDQGLDPQLTEILDEIDLRAQVELAKLG